jgi:hypothetical protein
MLFLVKNSLVKKEVRDGVLSDTTASFLVAKIRTEVFTHFHIVTLKCHSSMQN